MVQSLVWPNIDCCYGTLFVKWFSFKYSGGGQFLAAQVLNKLDSFGGDWGIVLRVIQFIIDVSLQLMANKQRGWAWTRAFLGVPSEELHVCGDHSCIDLTRRLCDLSGKEFQQYAYERLTSLTVDQEGLGPEGYAGLKPGDCVVAFSKRDLYSIRQQIEKATGVLPFYTCIIPSVESLYNVLRVPVHMLALTVCCTHLHRTCGNL